jgi:hypothetical protein
MRELLPGLYHWTATHPKIHQPVSSYWLEGDGVLIDPLVPAEVGLEWFTGRPVPPRAILLSNRHHYRESDRFVSEFDCRVLCNSAGLHEFTHGEHVEGFQIGDQLPGGVLACEVGALCPDETALYMPALQAIALADGVVRGGAELDGALGFVPDYLMDDPPATKRRLLAAYSWLLEQLDFRHLLLAHGQPVLDDGCEQLRELVTSGGRTAYASF